MKYKIYEMVKTTMGEFYNDHPPSGRFFLEDSDLNETVEGYSTFDEASDRIISAGVSGVRYTILSYTMIP